VIGYVGVGVTLTSVNQSTIHIIFTSVTQYDLKRVAYINTDTGVPDIASLFNIEFVSTRRMFDRWMKYINSVHFQFVGEDAKFETTEKNRELKTDDGTTVVDEDADAMITTVRYFKALYFNFINTVSETLPADLLSNPNIGFTTIKEDGNLYKGILMKAAMAVNTKEAQGYKLLAAPDTDESKLEV
jgi:hypothetical protein